MATTSVEKQLADLTKTVGDLAKVVAAQRNTVSAKAPIKAKAPVAAPVTAAPIADNIVEQAIHTHTVKVQSGSGVNAYFKGLKKSYKTFVPTKHVGKLVKGKAYNVFQKVGKKSGKPYFGIHVGVIRYAGKPE